MLESVDSAPVSSLAGTVALVTGASGGIGLATSRLLARHGARVAMVDLDETAVASRSAEWPDLNKSAGFACDVTSPANVDDLVRAVEKKLGPVDVLVNNAGVFGAMPIEKMEPAEFRRVVDVTLFGSWLLCRALVPDMKARGHGSIVNMSSIAGKTGSPNSTHYSATKAAVVGLTKALARETARFGVRVNAIQPGLIDTPMSAALPEQVYEATRSLIPLGRAGTPEDVAQAILFLAGPQSSFITGHVIAVDGGATM